MKNYIILLETYNEFNKIVDNILDRTGGDVEQMEMWEQDFLNAVSIQDWNTANNILQSQKETDKLQKEVPDLDKVKSEYDTLPALAFYWNNITSEKRLEIINKIDSNLDSNIINLTWTNLTPELQNTLMKYYGQK